MSCSTGPCLQDFLEMPVWKVFSGRRWRRAGGGARWRQACCHAGGEGRVLRIAASIAEGVLVDMRGRTALMDNAVLAAAAVLRAAGHRGLRGAVRGER